MDALLSADATLLAAKDEKGLGAYIAAKYSGRNDIATLLLEKGVELDIFAACMAGAKERVLALIGRESGTSQLPIVMTVGRRCIWPAFSDSRASRKR